MTTMEHGGNNSEPSWVLLRTRNGTMTVGAIPFFILQLSVLLVFTTHFSWLGVAVCVASYVVRMFAITGFFHRYFSHRTYKMGRLMQGLAAFIGTTATQKGPLWWASHHREHHKQSDTPEDPHNSREGFWHSHMLWFLYIESNRVEVDRVKDLVKFPELRLLDRFWYVPPVLLGVFFYLIGGWHLTVWGYFVSTFLLGNGTYTINSLMHYFGKQYFLTGDESRNHWLLALITLGEGWHNNHHRYQASARNGFYWYEYDFTYYTLRLLGLVGLVHDLNPVPAKVLEEGKFNRQLSQQARKEGRQYSPVKVMRGDILGRGDQVPAQVKVLQSEVQALTQLVKEKRDDLWSEMQGLSDQVGNKAKTLQSEMPRVSDHMADTIKSLRSEIQGLGDLVSERGRQALTEMQYLHDQVSDTGKRLRDEAHDLSVQMTQKGKELRTDVGELSELISATLKELGAEIQEMREQVTAKSRALSEEIERLCGQLPQQAY